MPVYEQPTAELCDALEEAMRRYHGHLADAEVKIDLLLAYAKTDANGDPVGTAIRHHGYPAAAIIRILGLRDRAKGQGDAEITVDGDRWELLSDAEQMALLDHELCHLELVVDSKGRLKRDDLERPRLASRRHDWQMGFFDEVVRRHGKASMEHKLTSEFLEKTRQLYLFEFETEAVA